MEPNIFSNNLIAFSVQTRLPDELVVCDDVSIDGTIEILQEFVKAAPFSVRIYQNNKNLGHEVNFGKVIDLCEGDIIFLSDQDDVWFPEKLATVELCFKLNDKALLFVNDVEITDGSLHPTGQNCI